MPLDTITMVLGGDIPLDKFSAALSRFTALLRALSGEAGRPDLEWMIDSLDRGSTLASVKGIGDPATVEAVVRRYGEIGIALEMNTPLRPYPRPVQTAAGRLRSIVGGRVESMRLETPERDAIIRPKPNGRPIRAKPIAFQPPPIPPPLNPAVRPAAGAFGAIDGRVQTLSNRGGLRFTLYDILEDKAISCYLVEGHEDTMRDAWGRLAIVEGWISRDPFNGRPLTIRRITKVSVKPDPTPNGYTEAKGISPPLTGLLPEHAIRRLRDA